MSKKLGELRARFGDWIIRGIRAVAVLNARLYGTDRRTDEETER